MINIDIPKAETMRQQTR